MKDVHIDLRLRPVRVGLLVRPTDRKSIVTFMRACACVWGGIYNPIIPVFRTFPPEWKLEAFERYKPAEIAKGYIRFFDPDVYVAAEDGLLDEVGLEYLRKNSFHEPRVVALKDFVACRDKKDWIETGFGVDIIDVISDLYKAEYQFSRKREQPAYIIKPNDTDGLAEAVFGRYPEGKTADYINENYADAFAAVEAEANPDTWIKVFKTHAIVPLYLTQHELQKNTILVPSTSYLHF
jgi:hypothetical protein